jgi:hypothetical protein
MESNIFQRIIIIVVVWIIVPIILFGLHFLSRSIVKQAKNGENKLSTRAGYWAGLIAFVVFLIYESSSMKFPDFNSISSIDLYFWILPLSGIMGYYFLHFLKTMIPTRMAGFVVLLLVFCSLSSLFSYFFIQAINDILMSLSLGTAFGVLIHIIISPKMINDIFKTEEPKS